MQRWERRERKKRAEAERMPKSGVSVRLLGRILAERAAEAKAKAVEDLERQPVSEKGGRHRGRR
ncbi:MAG: hypothetical protein ACRDIY_09410 [Chloroflexota bacterium]